MWDSLRTCHRAHRLKVASRILLLATGIGFHLYCSRSFWEVSFGCLSPHSALKCFLQTRSESGVAYVLRYTQHTWKHDLPQMLTDFPRKLSRASLGPRSAAGPFDAAYCG